MVVECDFLKCVSKILRLGEGFAKVLAVEDIQGYRKRWTGFETAIT